MLAFSLSHICSSLMTFRIRHSQEKCIIATAVMCVCLCVSVCMCLCVSRTAFLQYGTHPNVTLWNCKERIGNERVFIQHLYTTNTLKAFRHGSHSFTCLSIVAFTRFRHPRLRWPTSNCSLLLIASCSTAKTDKTIELING